MENRINATLPQTDLDAILSAVETIQSKLPFLVDLSPDERRRLPKFGDGSHAFVARAHEVAKADASFLPRSFDVDAFTRDTTLRAQLDTIRLAIGRLAEHLDDTHALVGADAYSAALDVYDALKRNGRGTALDGVADELARRFAQRHAPAPQP